MTTVSPSTTRTTRAVSVAPAGASDDTDGSDEAAEDGVPFTVVEAIKLIENEELANRCDEIWLIDCSPAIQRERIIDRGMDGPDMDQRLAVQAGIRERARARADRVIDTGVPMDQLKATVEEALADALADTVDILPLRSGRPPVQP